MRVLLDENLDWRLRRSFDPSFEVTTVQERGLAGVSNGALLRAAANDFDVFVTLDRNLQHQQHISEIDIAIVLIRSVHSRRSQIEPAMDRVNRAVAEAKPGTVTVVAV